MARVPLGAVVACALLASGVVQASVFQCPSGDVACLIASINTANGNGEDDIIELGAGTYTLTAVDNETDGPNGLPSVASPITITGVGAETSLITRGASAPTFRIVHVAAAGTLTLEGLTIRDGLSGFNNGGGLFNSGAMTITNSTITDNRTDSGLGSGLFNSGAMTITNSTIAGNIASDTNVGGIGNDGTLTITNSTIARNSGLVFGGIGNSGTLTITNSIIAHNTGELGEGGISNSGTLTITNSTIAANLVQSGNGGGIFNEGEGTVELQNTILAKNRHEEGFGGDPTDCFGPVTSLGNNLIGDTAGCTITLRASDLTGEPGLVAFRDDGAPGRGHVPLLPVSQAINAGNDASCPATDQLGQPRVGICDIGAVEFQPVVVVNDLVTFEPIRATFIFTPQPFACPGSEFAGTFSFEARLTNTSESALTDLVVGVTTLTDGNLLQNADVGPGGVGAGLTVPQQDDLSDGVLSPDEVVDVPFIICVTEREPFSFVVEVFGVVETSAEAHAR